MTSPHTPTQTFHTVLANSLIATITNSFVRFALTFWVFLSTKSLIATSLIGGIFAISNMFSAFVFGTIVDHNKKESVLRRSSLGSLVLYSIAALIYFTVPAEVFQTIASWQLRVLIIVLLFGSILGNLRNITISTLVSMLLPEDQHAQANGKVGMINGIWFTVTSLASGMMIGFLGMWRAILTSVVLTLLVLIHLYTFSIPESQIFSTHPDGTPKDKFDFRSTIATINTIPGLFALIFFTTFNNFVGGVFMSLMDAYWLLLVSVQTWGMMFAVLSLGFIASGIYISKYGLWPSPLRTMFRINLITWTVCIFFTIQPSIWLLGIGMAIWMFCSPFIEASESTVIQKVVPYEKQWRVFWFAQSVESAAMPITTFLIWPLTEWVFIPFMTDGYGARTIGSWFGTGTGRGIALVFITAGIIGLIVTLIAYHSKYYKLLSKSYKASNTDTTLNTANHLEIGIG